MISKLHAFCVFILFATVAGGVATGVVLAKKNRSSTDDYFNDKIPDFTTPENITDTPIYDNVNVPIWWDEFDGNELNRDYWQVMTGGNGWGNNEEQVYVDSYNNIEIFESKLLISAIKGIDGVYTSGRIMSKGSWYPGMLLPNGKKPIKIRFEAVITLPETGQGIWPAFWAFPADNKYGNFPMSGEIDIMELINNQDRLTQGIHYGGIGTDRVMNMTRTKAPDSTFSLGTFKFAVDWYTDKIVYSLDDVETVTFYSKSISPTGWYTKAANAGPDSPFDTGFKMILNIAIGGNWPKSPDATTPTDVTMFVEYVRVYADF